VFVPYLSKLNALMDVRLSPNLLTRESRTKEGPFEAPLING
jgi:hypothetical protein